MARKRLKSHTCPACGFVFSTNTKHANYCPHCGQENHNPRQPLLHYAYEFFETITHFDIKSWRSIKTILFSPGKITKDFIENRRSPYSPPARMFVFMLAIYVLITFFSAKQESAKILSPELKKLTASENFDLMPDTIKRPFPGPFLGWPVRRAPGISEWRELKKLSDSEIGQWLKKNGINNNLVNRYHARLQKKRISMNQTDEQYRKHFGTLLNLGVLIMFPLMSIFYFLIFYKRKLMYYDALIFALHCGIGLFIFLIAKEVVHLTWNRLSPSHAPAPSLILFLIFVGLNFFINVLPAAKRVFGFGWLSTTIRTIFCLIFCLLMIDYLIGTLELYL